MITLTLSRRLGVTLLLAGATALTSAPAHAALLPSKHVAIVACMDARLDVYSALGLQEGEAHVIRNAGGVVTETDDAFKAEIQSETGVKPAWSAEAFADVAEDVRQSIGRIRSSPFIPKTGSVRGLVFDVATGRLDEVA